jgi:hypothetical protein
MKTTKLARSYRIDDGKHFRLKDIDPADTGHWRSIENARETLQEGRLSESGQRSGRV